MQGIVRAHRRLYKQVLRRLIGDNVICDIVSSNEDLYYVLTTIQLSASPVERGSEEKTQFQNYLKELKEFKAAVNNGITTTDQLLKRHPKICLLSPLLVWKFLNLHPSQAPPKFLNQALPHDDVIARWLTMIEDLPKKVLIANAKGEVYQASPQELNAIKYVKLQPGVTERVFNAWKDEQMLE